MAIYDLKCGRGHVFEVIQSFTAPLPDCPSCGAATAKLPVRFGIGGGSTLPPPAEAMPQTWRGTYNGNAEYVTQLRHTADRRRALEERHPELAGDRRPILAHEGRYEAAPLRAGDPTPAAHSHSHSHPHPHPA
jgi:putative FmdB family regulatory protein